MSKWCTERGEVPEDEVPVWVRTIADAVKFSQTYGLSSSRLKESLKLSDEEVEKIAETIRKHFPDLAFDEETLRNVAGQKKEEFDD